MDGVPRWAPVNLKQINHRNTASSLLLHRANLAKLWQFCFSYLMPFSSVWDFIYKIRNCYWEKQKPRLLKEEKKKKGLYLPSVLQFHFAEYSLFGPYAFSVNLTLTPSHVLPPPLCRSFLTWKVYFSLLSLVSREKNDLQNPESLLAAKKTLNWFPSSSTGCLCRGMIY